MAFDVGEEARKQAIRVAVRCCPGRACHPSITSVGKKLFRLQRPKTILKKDVGDFEGIYSERQGGDSLCDAFFGPAIAAAIEKGEDALLMGFGARNTGKSATMRQAMLRAKSDVFESVAKLRAKGETTMVSMSAMMSAVMSPAQSHLTGRQVAHEVLLDALLPNRGDAPYKGGLHVREDPDRGFFCEGLTEVCVDSEHELDEHMDTALWNFDLEEQRCGSGGGAPLRIHRLLTLRVWRKYDGVQILSDVQILDLAGWQRASPGPQPKGGGGIKGRDVAFEDMVVKAMMRVVDSLEQGMSHIPYRDSKLTRLLKKALGESGNTLLAMHVSLDNYEETEAMLLLAQKIASITNNVTSSKTNFKALQDRHAIRIKELCRILGKHPASLNTTSMALDMASTDDEIQLHDLVSKVEKLCKLERKWESIVQASDLFKSGGRMPCDDRSDRKPQRAGIAPVHEFEIENSRSRRHNDTKADIEVKGEIGVAMEDKTGDSSFASKLAQLQLRKAGSTRLRAMS